MQIKTKKGRIFWVNSYGEIMEVNRNGGMTLLGLCSIDCPPNSTDMEIRNFGLTRITMDQIHDIIQDVEDLKYNDAQYQMNNELQNRDAQTKKGIYSDDFSNTAQSDIYHAEWDARVNEIARFVAPDRIPHSTVLSVDQAGSNASFFGKMLDELTGQGDYARLLGNIIKMIVGKL